MKISILLATYNGEKYLPEQLDSILNQDFKDFTLYISDDGSSDNTLKIIADYSKKDKRIKILSKHEPNRSACKHFLYMLENVESDLFLFSDQDDVWTQDHVIALVERYNVLSEDIKNKPILIHGDLEVVGENLDKISDSYINYMNLPKNPKNKHFYFVQNNVTGCVMLINNELKNFVFLNKQDLFKYSSSIIMHDSFFATIACEFGKKIYVDKAIELYRQHGKNVVGAYDTKSSKYIIRRFLDKKKYQEELNSYRKFALFFKTYFEEKLSEIELNKLSTFANLKEYSKIYRIFFVIKNGFLKHGIKRNIGYLLFI